LKEEPAGPCDWLAGRQKTRHQRVLQSIWPDSWQKRRVKKCSWLRGNAELGFRGVDYKDSHIQ
jgi:hypothetical protein